MQVILADGVVGEEPEKEQGGRNIQGMLKRKGSSATEALE